MTPSSLPFANESPQICCSLSAHQLGGVSGGGIILQERQFASLNLPGNEAESNLRRTTEPLQQRQDVLELAEPGIEIIAPTIELSAPFGLEITTDHRLRLIWLS